MALTVPELLETEYAESCDPGATVCPVDLVFQPLGVHSWMATVD